MRRQCRMPFDRRKRPRASAFVGRTVGLAHAERELRIMIEEERCDMVVEDQKQDVGLLFREPLLNRLVPFKYGSPYRIVLFVCVVRETDCGRMRTCDSANYFCHDAVLYH